jgi:hypothetical protein
MKVLGEPRLLDGARCDDPKLSGYLDALVLHHVRSGLGNL